MPLPSPPSPPTSVRSCERTRELACVRGWVLTCQRTWRNVRTRVKLLVARGLTFEPFSRVHPDSGHFLASLAAGVRVSSLFPFLVATLTSFSYLRRSSRDTFHLSFLLQRKNVEVVSVPVQVFINTYVHRIGIGSSVESLCLSLRHAWHIVSFFALASVSRTALFKCASITQTEISLNANFDRYFR